MEDGLGQLRNVLEDEGYVRPMPDNVIRPDILMRLNDLGQDSPVDPRLVQLVSSVIAYW